MTNSLDRKINYAIKKFNIEMACEGITVSHDYKVIENKEGYVSLEIKEIYKAGLFSKESIRCIRASIYNYALEY